MYVVFVHKCGGRGVCRLGAYMWGRGVYRLGAYMWGRGVCCLGAYMWGRGVCHLGAYMRGEGCMSSWCIRKRVYVVLKHMYGEG